MLVLSVKFTIYKNLMAFFQNLPKNNVMEYINIIRCRSDKKAKYGV